MSSATQKREIYRLLPPTGGAEGPEAATSLAPGPAEDEVVVEAPLELQVRGEPFVTSMRTPGNDRAMLRGLLYGEGIIDADDELVDLCELPVARGDGERRVFALDRDVPDELRRSLMSSSSCGVCGSSTIRAVGDLSYPVHKDLSVSAAALTELVNCLNAKQSIFSRTGGSHAAALFTAAGNLLCHREDVGRHNAVDKVVGALLTEHRLHEAAILVVSGRVSFEIMQKAVRAGIGLVAAVSAPTSLAIDLAEQFHITLCGFVRQSRLTIYSHQWRVLDTENR